MSLQVILHNKRDICVITKREKEDGQIKFSQKWNEDELIRGSEVTLSQYRPTEVKARTSRCCSMCRTQQRNTVIIASTLASTTFTFTYVFTF